MLTGVMAPYRSSSADCVQDAFERPAKSGRARPGIGDPVVLASVGQRFAAIEYLADDLDVLRPAQERLAVGGAVPAFHHLRARRPDAEDEATVGERLDRRRPQDAGRAAGLGLSPRRLPMRGRSSLCFPEASRTGNREATSLTYHWLYSLFFMNKFCIPQTRH
jgi:hypothetical protein